MINLRENYPPLCLALANSADLRAGQKIVVYYIEMCMQIGVCARAHHSRLSAVKDILVKATLIGGSARLTKLNRAIKISKP
jgi:Zn-dependent alcohol dehydrogenase